MSDGKQSNLDPETVYELIQGHGRTDMYLHFATVIGDFQRVIEHWILEDEWTKAIDVINRQVCSDSFNIVFHDGANTPNSRI